MGYGKLIPDAMQVLCLMTMMMLMTADDGKEERIVLSDDRK